MTTTAAALFDSFLLHRATVVTPRTVARDHKVVERLREYLDASGPVFLDEFTGRRLARDAGGVGLCDLVDIDAVATGLPHFLGEWLPEEERRRSAHVVRLFVLWAQRGGELDPCSALTLQTLTARYAPVPRRPRGRYRPYRARWS